MNSHEHEHQHKNNTENQNKHSHEHNHEHSGHEESEENRGILFIRLAISLVLVLCARFLPFEQWLVNNSFLEHIPFLKNFTSAQLAITILYLAAYIASGIDVVINAVKNLFHGNFFDETFLMAIASIGAFIIGEYPEAVMVMLLYQIGETLQDAAVDKSRDSITALAQIRPDSATVLRNGKTFVVAPEEVEIGELITIKPGERIPLDGVIVDGTAFIDTSALTGESVPRKVEENDTVLSGCICKDSVLTVKVSKKYADSAVARILELVEDATEKKTKSEKFITKFSRVYTPTVVACAVLLAVLPPLIFSAIRMVSFGNASAIEPLSLLWNRWIYRALLFLVVSCPCALVISVPLGFFCGIGAASRKGILVKGSNYLDALAKVGIAVFDKTGTLTKGTFTVTGIHPSNSEIISADELVKIAAHAEAWSTHPISSSLRTYHHGHCCETAILSNVNEISGQGISATLDGKTVLAGNARLMKAKNAIGFSDIMESIGEAQVTPEECAAQDGGTIVHVAVDGVYAGHIVISDELKPDAAQTVKSLKSHGDLKVIMLTGDSEAAAKKITDTLELDEYHAELLPNDKVVEMENLMNSKQSQQTLLYAGDGINDAPVLARADIGVAMGAYGSDAAIEAADIVIMTDETSKIAEAILIGKKTHLIVKENILFALAIKFAVLLLGATGFATMWLAVFADVGVSFLAIFNSLRLMRIK